MMPLMMDIGAVTASLANAILSEGARAGVARLSGRANRLQNRDAAYSEFVLASQRAQVRLLLLQAVVKSRSHPWRLIPNVTGFRAHVDLVDRLADDVVRLASAWDRVVQVGSEDVAETGQGVIDAITTLETTSAKSRMLPSRRSRRPDSTTAGFEEALERFRAAAADDLGR